MNIDHSVQTPLNKKRKLQKVISTLKSKTLNYDNVKKQSWPSSIDNYKKKE